MHSRQTIAITSLAVMGGSAFFVNKKIGQSKMSDNSKAIASGVSSLLIAGTILSTRVSKVDKHGLLPAFAYRAAEIGSALVGGQYCTP